MPFLADGILHYRLTAPPSPLPANPLDDDSPEMFVFNEGTFVTWGASKTLNRELQDLIKEGEVNAYDEIETECYDYYHDNSLYILFFLELHFKSILTKKN
jgi:hypothetical protein